MCWTCYDRKPNKCLSSIHLSFLLSILIHLSLSLSISSHSYLIDSQWSLPAITLSHHELSHFLLNKPQLPGLLASALAFAELQFSSASLSHTSQWNAAIQAHAQTLILPVYSSRTTGKGCDLNVCYSHPGWLKQWQHHHLCLWSGGAFIVFYCKRLSWGICESERPDFSSSHEILCWLT